MPTKAVNDPESLAISALLFLSAETETLSRFLALTGLDPSDIRAAAQDRQFLLAVLDFLMTDEPALIAFAAAEGLAPEAIAASYHRLKRDIDPGYDLF